MSAENFRLFSIKEIDSKFQTLNILRRQQKDLFFIIINKFIQIVNAYFNTSYIKTEDGEKPIHGNFWLKWIGERFEDFLLTVIYLFIFLNLN